MLDRLELFKHSCSESMTKSRRKIRLWETRYNSALWQYNRLLNEERIFKVYLRLAEPANAAWHASYR